VDQARHLARIEVVVVVVRRVGLMPPAVTGVRP